jgi:hypothetical protein
LAEGDSGREPEMRGERKKEKGGKKEEKRRTPFGGHACKHAASFPSLP